MFPFTRKRGVLALAIALCCAIFLMGQSRQAGFRLVTLQEPSGDLTTAQTPRGAPTLGFAKANVILDVTKLDLPDSDDFVRFFFQTSYDGGAIWCDVENITFSNTDDCGGACSPTKKRTVVIDGRDPRFQPGTGTLKNIAGTDPAAGSEISETVPSNSVWRILTGAATLTTGPTAGARIVRAIQDDGTTTFHRSKANTNTTNNAATVFVFNTRANLFGEQSGDVITAGVSRDLMAAGDRLRTDTSGLLGEDNWGAPLLKVEEWHDPSVCTDGTMRDDVRSYGRPVGSHVRIKTTVAGATPPTYAYSATATVR